MNSSERSFRVISINGGLWLEKDGWTFNLEPPETIKLSLPPYVEGLDWFIREAMKAKSMDCKFIKVIFSESLFLGCDARLSYESVDLGGWRYSLFKEFMDFDSDRKLWICRQMRLYFDQPPRELFVSIVKE